MHRSLGALAIACLVHPALARAQVETQPTPIPGRPPVTGPRDQAEPARAPSASISGRVVAADSGGPLRRVSVSLASQDSELELTASTDAYGRYHFQELPKGRYSIRARKPGYAPTAWGQKHAYQSPHPIEVGEGQRVEHIDLSLVRGGVITGRLTDEFGEALPGASVAVLRSTSSRGSMALVGMGSTDDRGIFRVYGLATGEYCVSAQTHPDAASSDPSDGFARTFYPGTSLPSEARRVRVTAGQETTSANFALIPARLVKVSGTVVTSKGAAAVGGYAMLAPALDELPGFGTVGGGGAPIAQDGSFTLTGVGPGEYVLSVHAEVGGEGAENEMGLLRFTVNGTDDLSGLVVTSFGPSTIAGQIVFEAGSAPEHASPSEVVMYLQNEMPDAPVLGGAGALQVNEDWTFEGSAHGSPLYVGAARVPAGWMLKAVLLNGTDVTDTGIPTRSGERVDDVQLVLTNRITRVSCSAVDEGGRAVRDFTAIVFADEPAGEKVAPRRLRHAAADQQGRAEIAALPAGRYLAAAVQSVDEILGVNPEWLEAMRADATPFDLREGESKAVSVKLVTVR